MILLLLPGCAPEPGTLQPLVDARAEQIALDATLACRLGLASGDMVAQLAPKAQPWWTNAAQDDLVLSEDLELLLGLDDGEVVTDSLTGGSSVTWTDVEFSPEVWGSVELDVLRPREQFVVTFQQDDEPRLRARSRVTVLDPDGDPELAVDLDLEVSESAHSLRMPVDDTRLFWPEGGGPMPVSGTFQWWQEHPAGTRLLTSLPPDQATEDRVWMVVVEAEDWAKLTSLDLRR